MKALLLFFLILPLSLTAQSKTEKEQAADWKFLTFQGSEKIYYLPASLKSAGDIFRIKLLRTSETQSEIQYTVFVEDYDRTNAKNRVIQVNTYDKFWRPIDQINLNSSEGEELWVHMKKGSECYKLYECLLAGIHFRTEDQ